jgi:hypothetical protein
MLPERIADAYRRAAAPVRRMLLERLLRPVGSLALGAIASRAFSTFLLSTVYDADPRGRFRRDLCARAITRGRRQVSGPH